MLIASLTAVLLAAGAPEMMIPEGTILPVVLNETLNTARVQENDPVLFSLAEDIRAAGRRGPILIPRGSDVVGRIVRSQRAGEVSGTRLIAAVQTDPLRCKAVKDSPEMASEGLHRCRACFETRSSSAPQHEVSLGWH